MKIKVTYYIPVEREIEMTPEEYCLFHADGKLHGEKVIPDNAIYEEVTLPAETREELTEYFYKNF